MDNKKEVKERMMRLYNHGYRDEDIAKALNLKKTQVLRFRKAAGLEANTALTGLLGLQLKRMLLKEKDTIHTIVTSDKKEDCEQLRELCTNCSLYECVDCIAVIRRKHEKMVAEKRKAV